MQDAIEVTSVNYSYRAVPALIDVTATFPAGTSTTLLGHNGSGKSTLIAVLAGLSRPDSGLVVMPAGLSGAPAAVALVPQRSAAAEWLPLTVRDVVTMGRWKPGRRRLKSDDRRAVELALEQVSLNGLAGRLIGELSGGQRQRTLVAQALARAADILLLDEPTAGCDSESVELINLAVAREVYRGAVVVQATHDLGAARSATRLLTLAGGRIVGDQPAAHVHQAPEPDPNPVVAKTP